MKKASSDLFLLDVNVLVALAWPNHQFNRAARRRFVPSAQRLATCAITQLGFIRLSSNPASVEPAKTPHEAAEMLQAIIDDEWHVYLEALPAPSSAALEHVLGSRQVTDAYLLQLAAAYDATFVTFDGRMGALAGSETAIEILGL